MNARGAERTKNLILRLQPELADQLALIADVEGRSVSDLLREAVTGLVERRRRDRAFLRLLDDAEARHQEMYRNLRGR